MGSVDTDQELEKRLTQAVERMPAFPRSVQKVLELTRDINCMPRDLVMVIETDPVMTLKILRVINSAYYGLRNRITSVGQAVVYLGLNTTKNLALSFAAVGVLPSLTAKTFDLQGYLLHSLVVAAFARQLATSKARGQVDPMECYVAGLLHDFGKAVFANFLPDELEAATQLVDAEGIPLHEAERRIIGRDHAYVGAMLVERWQFSAELVDCIRHHHDDDAPRTPMLDCLQAANQLARYLHIGNSGNPYRPAEAPAASHRFGDSLDVTAQGLGDIQPYIDDALLIADLPKGP
ncbi:MAG: HDOD domain-containing protein [Myxococcota bacterium]